MDIRAWFDIYLLSIRFSPHLIPLGRSTRVSLLTISGNAFQREVLDMFAEFVEHLIPCWHSIAPEYASTNGNKGENYLLGKFCLWINFGTNARNIMVNMQVDLRV